MLTLPRLQWMRTGWLASSSATCMTSRMVSTGMDCFLVPWMPKTRWPMPFLLMNSAYSTSGSSFSTRVL
ncbi:hypothetical protein IMZ48_22365 [Candidatus Bathyarchaeota archaeon]|nr:hypothetical protein [Candidatus Bathyarchaeota archaeon]